MSHRLSRRGSLGTPRAINVIAAIAVVAAVYLSQELLVPLALAMVFAFLLAPFVRWLERLRLPRVLAVVIVTAIASSIILSVGFIVGQQMYKLTEDLPRYQDEIVKKAHALSGKGGAIGQHIGKLGTAIATAAGADSTAATTRPMGSSANPVYTVVVPSGTSSVQTVFGFLGLALGPLGTAAIVAVLVVFILLAREDMRDRCIRLVSRGRYIVTTEAINDGARRVSRYVLAQSMLNGGIGVAIGTGLWLIGLIMGHGTSFPSFLLWGLLYMLLRFVPYLGAWIAALFPITVSLAVFPGFGVFFATVGLIVVVELISTNVFEPWLYGSSTGLSAVAVLVAAIFWTWLWGPIGLLLSTPMTVCIVVLGKYVPQFQFLDILLSDEPALPPPVSFYQRLLAGDEREAANVVQTVAKENGQTNVYDAVFVPALRMARRDRVDRDLSAENERKIYQAIEKMICPGDRSPCTPDVAGDLESDIGSSNPAHPLIVAIPAHHASEELTLQMFDEVMHSHACRVHLLSTRLLPSEIEAIVAREMPAVVVLSVLPPGGGTQARYLCRRLRRKFRDLRIVVQYLGRPRDYDGLLVGFRKAGATTVNTSIQQSAAQVRSILKLPDEVKPSADKTPTEEAIHETSA